MNRKTNAALSIDHCSLPKNENDFEGMYWYLTWLMAKHGIKSDALGYLKKLYKRGEMAAQAENLFSSAVHLADNAEPISEQHQADPDEHIILDKDLKDLQQSISNYRSTRAATKKS